MASTVAQPRSYPIYRGRLTRKRLAVLAAIEADQVTWKSNLGGRYSYRLWPTEVSYAVVTPFAAWAVGERLARRWDGIGTYHASGGVELTGAGRVALHEALVGGLARCALGLAARA